MDTLIETKESKIINLLAVPKISVSRLLFFIIWPFGALLNALHNFRQPYAKTVFWLFCIYYGFVFIYEDPSLGKFRADSGSYAHKLIELHNNPVSFSNLVRSLYKTEEGLLDVYQPLTTWVVSLFTDNPHWLFAVFAAIFGFFYSQNIWVILKRANNKKIDIILFLFILFFALLNPIWNINGVRMWTATQIFVYGCLLFFLEQNKKGLIWVILTPLVHFSFVLPVIVFLFYHIIPDYLFIFFVFYIVTSFYNIIDIPRLKQYLTVMPDIFQPRVETYLSEDYYTIVTKANENLSWHVKFAVLSNRIIVYLWVITCFLIKALRTQHKTLLKLFSFALFFGGFANLADQVPSGGRLITISNCLFFVVFILVLIKISGSNRISLFKYISIPFLVFSILFMIRMGLGFTGALTFFGNPIIALIVPGQIPLIQLIKEFI